MPEAGVPPPWVQAVKEAQWRGDWETRGPEFEHVMYIIQQSEAQQRLPAEVLFR